ncbi:hypothetical protein M0R45_026383 [Rubus argutus]|uniref:FAE domain-containing protein n=1 Tax=Rubus argutus TaxID=59490 RepID=A0AAW1WZQ4_RUBAR
MGCSAGILSIYLTKDLLKVHKNSLALVLSMEAATPNGYGGKKKLMHLPSILFQMGEAAILLSNRKQDKGIAKYEVEHLVRTHIGSDDEAYQSVFQKSDEDGIETLVATKALKTNLSALGPMQKGFIMYQISRR